MGIGKLTKKYKHIRIKIKRKIIIAATILLGILLTYFIVTDRDSVVELAYQEDVIEYVTQIGDEYNNYLMGMQLDSYLLEQVIENLIGVQAFFYDENGLTFDSKEKVFEAFGEYGRLYYFKGRIDEENGELEGTMFNDPRGVCELGNDQLIELFKSGTYYNANGDRYNSVEIEKTGYVFMEWGMEDILKKFSICDISDRKIDDNKTIMRINGATGMIDDADERSLIGTDFNNIYPLENIQEVLEKGKFVSLNDGRKAFMYARQEMGGDYFCAYMYYSDILYMYFRTCAMPILLGWVFLLLIMGYVLEFNKAHSAEEKSEIAYLHIAGDIYTDGRLVYHTIGLELFAIVLISCATLYLHSLINYSNNSIETSNSLILIDALYQNENDNKHILRNDYNYAQELLLEGIADYYLNYPLQIKKEESLKRMLAYMPGVQSITVYDKSGTIEYDTKNHIGYTISKDELADEYVMWDLLNGRTDIVYYNSGFDSYYFAGRRQDKDGIIRIEVASYVMDSIEHINDIDSLLAEGILKADIKGYIDNSSPEEFHYITKDSKSVTNIKKEFSEEKLSGTHTFIENINGKNYMMDVKAGENYTFLMGDGVTRIYGKSSLKMILGIFVVFFLHQIMILVIGMRHKEDKPAQEISLRDASTISYITDDVYENIMDNDFRKLIRNMFLVTCVCLAALLLADLRYGETPILKYLFGSNWEKGLNLFSLTMLLIIGVGGMLISRILQSMIILFTSNMGPRGLTIGRMVSSLLKFAFLILIIILMLYNVGVNPGTLLAGAGIVGAMISFCAQQTVNDMLSGFFIVFENLFNIGDWITVDDFRGQVCEIGIRTTKLRIADTYKIYNNSELKKITIMEDNGRGAICLVDVAYEEDINRVIQLIKQSEQRYKEEIPDITFGPKVDGILELGSSGITVRIWAHSEINRVNFVERELRRVTKNIFDENGVTIPFNQVTIHNAE